MPEPGFYWIQLGNARWVPAEYTGNGWWYILYAFQLDDEGVIPTHIGPRLQPPTS